MKPRTL